MAIYSFQDIAGERRQFMNFFLNPEYTESHSLAFKILDLKCESKLKLSTCIWDFLFLSRSWDLFLQKI